uniref:Uncharacterized protein n=1 Tax=Arundo donax TaxID=35708 RepID=A0A0A9EG42_ARUDO
MYFPESLALIRYAGVSSSFNCEGGDRVTVMDRRRRLER